MRSSRLRFAVSLSLATLVGCGGGSQMGGGNGGIGQTIRHRPALRKAGISHPRLVHQASKPLLLCRLAQSSGWHTFNPSVLETVPYVLRQIPSFRNHRWSGQLIGQVIFGVWPGAVPERCARTRPGISVERKLSFHRRVCGSRYGHSDRSEGQTSDRTLYRDHARGREYSQHFYAAYPIHYSR